jgi:hypothetical protein
MRYFFDLIDDRDITEDSDGVECETFDQMRHKAMTLLAEVAAHTSHKSNVHRLSVQVHDGLNKPCYRATLTIEGEAAHPLH